MTIESPEFSPSATQLLLDSFARLYADFGEKIPEGYALEAFGIRDPKWISCELELIAQLSPTAREFRYSHYNPDENMLKGFYQKRDGIALVLFQKGESGDPEPVASAVMTGDNNLSSRGAGVGFCSITRHSHNADLLAHVLIATAFDSHLLDSLAIQVDMNNDPMRKAFKRWRTNTPHAIALTNMHGDNTPHVPQLTKPALYCPLMEGSISLDEPTVVSLLHGSIQNWRQLHRPVVQTS